MLPLTPQSRAVTAFVLGYALVAGYLDRLGLAVASIVNGDHSGGISLRTRDLTIHGVSLLAGIVVLVLARRAAAENDEGWARTISQAAQVVTLVGIAIAVVALVGAAVDRAYGFTS